MSNAPSVQVVVEYAFRDEPDGYWIGIWADRSDFTRVGPFETPEERQRALDDMLGMIRSVGGVDLPLRPQ